VASQTLLDCWDGAVEIAARDFVVKVDGALARRLRPPARPHDAWRRRRRLVVTRHPHLRTQAGWRITHEHDSVPFHMDGSFRATVDL
jgi:hypothetical protein